jgi:hypothetical protein
MWEESLPLPKSKMSNYIANDGVVSEHILVSHGIEYPLNNNQ